MKLKKLIKNIPVQQVKGSKDLDITGVCTNSKLVAPGNIFIARKGLSNDGQLYIPEAIAAGAVAVVTDIYDPLLNKSVTQVISPHVDIIEGLIVAEYYQFPANELLMVGITGTNGKTTTSFLIKHLLDQLNKPCGLIGTIEYIVGHHRYKATRTTPDAASNQKMLREMVNQKCQSAIMEVSSHALEQHRVDCINFDIAIFTNLTVDHLDYHQTMENYCLAKNKLFTSLKPSDKKKCFSFAKKAIINRDDPWSELIVKGCRAEVLTYGINNEADLKAEDIEFSSSGTTLTLIYAKERAKLHWPLIGRYNTYNCLAAAAVGISLKIPLPKIAEILATVPFVSGRLEKVPNPLDLQIYVDFAHSDDALQNVLLTLNEIKKGKIITVFGCGGNRDASKRSKMAASAEKLSDHVFVTSDNPRNEDPAEIARQIIQGFTVPTNYVVELDRYKAIEKAITLATPDDIILIAGKGHEPYQIFAHQTIEFDDRKIAAEICQKKYSMHQKLCNKAL